MKKNILKNPNAPRREDKHILTRKTNDPENGNFHLTVMARITDLNELDRTIDFLLKERARFKKQSENINNPENDLSKIPLIL